MKFELAATRNRWRNRATKCGCLADFWLIFSANGFVVTVKADFLASQP